MPENHSQAGRTVERVSITDEPHERYRGFDPWTGEELKHGIPILTSTPGGNVIEKNVEYFTVKCPECKIEAKYTHENEPVCPECGIVCAGKDIILGEQMVIDAKAAGRIDGDEANTSV